MKKNIRPIHICMIALAIGINIVGSNIALMLRLPIYLDSIGTFLLAYTCGPVLGIFPSLLSGLILGMTSDIYSLYYAPVGILLGFLAGWIKKKRPDTNLFIFALAVTLPTSLLSAGITAFLFGGITSSGTSFLVQILSKTPLGLTISCFIVQFITDFMDRLISLWIVKKIAQRLSSLRSF